MGSERSRLRRRSERGASPLYQDTGSPARREPRGARSRAEWGVSGAGSAGAARGAHRPSVKTQGPPARREPRGGSADAGWVGLDENVKPGAVWVPGACCPWIPMEGGGEPNILWFRSDSTTSCRGRCKPPRISGGALAQGGVELSFAADPIPLPRVMAKKTRKQRQRATTRRPGPSVARPTTIAPTAVAVEAEDLQPAPEESSELATVDPGRRRVERVSPADAPVARPKPSARGLGAGYIQPLESEDAAIPFDRVPYVPADLRRVAIIAGLMITLIIIADIIVSNVVK